MTVIFTYKGLAPYLPHTVRQAALASRKHRVVVIADEDPAPGFCEFYRWDDYNAGQDEFEGLLYAPNDFERRSFSRHLIIQNWCKKHGVSRYFCADHDVIITTDLGKVCDVWSWCDFTMSMCKDARHTLPDGRTLPVGHASHSMVTLRALNGFIKYSRRICKQRTHGCEMLVWTEFAHMGGFKWADTANVLDHNLGTQLNEYHNVEFEGTRYKWIDWETPGGPYKVRFDGRREFMPIIHCWSGSKGWIPEWCHRLEMMKYA